MTTSAQAYERFSSRFKTTITDHDPNSTAATDVAWVDMNGYRNLTVIAFASALTGNGATALTIVANSNATGTGDEEVVKTHAVGDAPDAVGDWLILQVSEAEIAGIGETAGENLRYVSAKITLQNQADEQVVIYIQEAKVAYAGLSADTVA